MFRGYIFRRRNGCDRFAREIPANENNKIRFISMLKKIFQESNFSVKQAAEDADTLIINTAIDMSSAHDSVVVVGEDIDLLVLLIGLARSLPNVYFRKPARGKIAQKLYSSQSFQYGEAIADNILFLHAFSGCDITSALYNIGKNKFFSILEKNPHLNNTVQIFKQREIDPEIIATVGERFLIALYGGNKGTETLDSLRYQRFAKSITKSKFNLALLPPTREAARQHSFRMYHQVQAWFGISKNPQE